MFFNFSLSPNNKKQIFVIFGALVVLVLLLFLPKSLEKEIVKTEFNFSSTKLDEAVSLVETSENPMKGIMMLKEILEENPQNAQAVWFLGKFSMRSGQYDKAIERFLNFIAIVDENDDKASGYIMLSDAYFLIERLDLAKESIRNAESLTSNMELDSLIKERKINLFN